MPGESAAAARVFVHPQGICESATVGAGTRVWAFAHVLPGPHRRALQHLRSRLHRERRHHRRSRHGEKWRPDLGRPADRRRCVHRAERDVLERQVSPEQALPARGDADPRRQGRVDRRRRRDPAGHPDRRPRDGRRRRRGHARRASRAIVFGNPARIVGYVDAQRRAPAAPTPQADRGARHERRRRLAASPCTGSSSRWISAAACRRAGPRPPALSAAAHLSRLRRPRQGRPWRARAQGSATSSDLRKGIAGSSWSTTAGTAKRSRSIARTSGSTCPR
jgi:hypothetical protein